MSSRSDRAADGRWLWGVERRLGRSLAQAEINDFLLVMLGRDEAAERIKRRFVRRCRNATSKRVATP